MRHGLVDPGNAVFAPQDAEFRRGRDAGKRKRYGAIKFHSHSENVGTHLNHFRDVHGTQGFRSDAGIIGEEQRRFDGFAKNESPVPNERSRCRKRGYHRSSTLGFHGYSAGRNERNAGSRSGIRKKEAAGRKFAARRNGSGIVFSKHAVAQERNRVHGRRKHLRKPQRSRMRRFRVLARKEPRGESVLRFFRVPVAGEGKALVGGFLVVIVHRPLADLLQVRESGSVPCLQVRGFRRIEVGSFRPETHVYPNARIAVRAVFRPHEGEACRRSVDVSRQIGNVGEIRGGRQSVKRVVDFSVYRAVIDADTEPIVFRVLNGKVSVRFLRKRRKKRLVVRKDEHSPALPMVGSHVSVYGDGSSEFRKNDDGDVMAVFYAVEEIRKARSDVADVVIQILRNVVRIEIR